MPYVNAKVMADVLTPEQKIEVAQGITEAFVAIAGEPVRNVTMVTIEEVDSGSWMMGGDTLTTEGVHDLLAGEPAPAG
jgi:4-oxalocrotonate tautomerase